jgi:hypothetical protein
LLQRTAAALGQRIGTGHTISISAPLNLTVNGGADSGEFRAALEEHIEHISQELQRLLAIRTERQATV